MASNNASTISTLPKPTFAEKTKSKITPLTEFQYPEEDQAIIFRHIENTKILDYLKAFLTVIKDPKAIIAASRVSNNRVVIFLDSADRVNNLLATHKYFLLGENNVTIHRLRSPTSKIILSNVSPAIPNSVLLDHLVHNFKLECTSPISILRVNPTDELFSHVISWRRQLYIKTKPDLNLPPSFTIEYNNRSYRIFITFDELTCFKCHKTGHKAEDCHRTVDLGNEFDNLEDSPPVNGSPSQLTTFSYPLLQPTSTTHSSIPPINAMLSADKPTAATTSLEISSSLSANSVRLTPEAVDASKRWLSDISSASSPTLVLKKSRDETETNNLSDSLLSDSDGDLDDAMDHSNSPLTLKQIFEPLASHYQENLDKFPLTFQNFTLFIDMCKGKQRITDLLKDFQMDTKIKELIFCIKDCRPYIKHSSTKNRLTRLYKKLEQLQPQTKPARPHPQHP